MLTRRSTGIIRAVICALAVLAMAAPAGAQALRLTLAADKTEFVPGEPVVLYLTIANRGETELQIPSALTPEYGYVQYRVQRENGGEAVFEPWIVMENTTVQRLAPAASVSTQGRIFFGARGWTFAEPGTYRVRATFREASSPAVELRVASPPASVDREQSARLIASRDAGLFLLFDGGDHLREGVKTLQDVAASNSSLSGYANYSLGAAAAKQFADVQTGTVRPPNLDEAQRYLKKGDALLPADAIYYRLKSKDLMIDVSLKRGLQNEAEVQRRELRFLVDQEVMKKAFDPGIRSFAQSIKRQ